MAIASSTLPRGSHMLSPAQMYNFGPVEIHLFGRNPGDIGRALDPSVRDQMASYVRTRRVSRLFNINPKEFNARVVGPEGAFFGQMGTHEGVEIYFDTYLDGVVGLSPGSGFWLRSGDCATVVLVGHGEVAALHGGLHSLLVPYWKEGFSATPNRPSVIQNAVLQMATRPDEIHARILCGIGPESYILRSDIPKHAPHNARLTQEVRTRWGSRCIRRISRGTFSLSIPDLVTAQLRQLGVPKGNITWDEIDTMTDRHDGTYTWYSQARSETQRNHVLVLVPRH